MLVLWRGPVLADEGGGSAQITRLNKQALEAFDNLNFDQAKALLEQALTEAESAGMSRDPQAARLHLNLGMLFIAGFQKTDEAVAQFKMALEIQPSISAPAGLFNPEVQAVFDETKTNFKSDAPASAEQTSGKSAAPVTKKPLAKPKPVAREANEETEATSGDEADVEAEAEGDGSPVVSSGILLSLGLGSGFGIGSGGFDANKNVTKVSGGSQLAGSKLGHITVAGGYYMSPNLMLSLEGRLQFITGTTKSPSGTAPPGSAISVMAKANWYLASGPVRPFLVGGLGAGAIRQVVAVHIQDTDGKPVNDCGSGSEACVDTVTGGPLFLVAGGGVSYELGSVALLGTLTANLGVPHFMTNFDAAIGIGLHL